jgi:hypothetical protein
MWCQHDSYASANAPMVQWSSTVNVVVDAGVARVVRFDDIFDTSSDARRTLYRLLTERFERCNVDATSWDGEVEKVALARGGLMVLVDLPAPTPITLPWAQLRASVASDGPASRVPP